MQTILIIPLDESGDLSPGPSGRPRQRPFPRLRGLKQIKRLIDTSMFYIYNNHLQFHQNKIFWRGFVQIGCEEHLFLGIRTHHVSHRNIETILRCSARSLCRGGGGFQFGGKRKWAIFARRKTEIFDFLRRKSEFKHERKQKLAKLRGGNRKKYTLFIL